MLTIGSQGEAVKDWQAFLVGQGCLGSDGRPLSVDGDFGANTAQATRQFQTSEGLTADGVVGPATLAKAKELGFFEQDEPTTRPDLNAFPFIQAKHYNVANRARVDVIVIHTMECSKSDGRAKQVATWFGSDQAPQASAHFCVDEKEIYQCVLEKDIAWHAPGANDDGIGIEHAGYAAQTQADWQDSYNQNMLSLSAKLTASLCARYNIPIVWLSSDDLKSGKRGICGHVDVTNAFSQGHGHTDPGPNFPKERYLSLVRTSLENP